VDRIKDQTIYTYFLQVLYFFELIILFYYIYTVYLDIVKWKPSFNLDWIWSGVKFKSPVWLHYFDFAEIMYQSIPELILTVVKSKWNTLNLHGSGRENILVWR
jgi:hypothetical protein